jgi:hypothetical protein
MKKVFKIAPKFKSIKNKSSEDKQAQSIQKSAKKNKFLGDQDVSKLFNIYFKTK